MLARRGYREGSVHERPLTVDVDVDPGAGEFAHLSRHLEGVAPMSVLAVDVVGDVLVAALGRLGDGGDHPCGHLGVLAQLDDDRVVDEPDAAADLAATQHHVVGTAAARTNDRHPRVALGGSFGLRDKHAGVVPTGDVSHARLGALEHGLGLGLGADGGSQDAHEHHDDTSR
jgi:hypothetical protein